MGVVKKIDLDQGNLKIGMSLQWPTIGVPLAISGTVTAINGDSITMVLTGVDTTGKNFQFGSDDDDE